MGIFDDIIEVDENGNINYVGWVKWKHVSGGIWHCPVCLILDKCWFSNSLKPELPQHEKCHCIVEKISTPIPQNNTEAACDIRKFTEYIFSDKYSWNGKRKLYESLGFTVNDSNYLKKEYEIQALKNYCNSKYKLGKLDSQGQRINIDIEFMKNNRKLKFASGWMVRPEGLITNNTPLAD